ncbi:MAG: hypothetical protein HND48_20400 [Chloroflexi bacterium]|nr:hypothetical protein [Chloroflexota bacterium]
MCDTNARCAYLVIAEGVLARAGLAALLADVAEVDVAGQIAPAGGLSDDLGTRTIQTPWCSTSDMIPRAGRWRSAR